MTNKYTASGIATRIWFLTSAVFTVGFFTYLVYDESYDMLITSGFAFMVSLILSLPALLIIYIAIHQIENNCNNWQVKFRNLVILQLIITSVYGIIAAAFKVPIMGWLHDDIRFFYTVFIVSSSLFAATVTASFILLRQICIYFSDFTSWNYSYGQVFNLLFQHTSKNKSTMETFNQEAQPVTAQLPVQSQSNKLFIKGVITGVLILLMLIPTLFINNIINEREQRQMEVVKEVSSKWASAQTISGPYLVVPYTDTTLNNAGLTVSVSKQLILLANDLNVDGKIFPEERPRSIYKVLLYKSALKISGSFKPSWPADIKFSNIDLTHAKLCFGISDFKGIEEEIRINFNNTVYPFSPGLPLNDLSDIGLSVPVSLSPEMLNAGIPFSMDVKLKGSEKLHFMPLGANSKFSIGSVWPNPSFDGNSLPNDRQVNEKGFAARWNFNQANLPYGTVIKQGSINKMNMAFGVSMVQPADQYNKTMRSVKYAILFIGLTFAFFFIIEIMQHKPFHPVQYVLVGLALVIFYTLLLSISEYILFDLAYLIASLATVLLISLYAKSHFASWKTGGIFFTSLSLLYGFIFILIRLEDTALLVGSIGLFIVLALVMYASRKINWYGGKVSSEIGY